MTPSKILNTPVSLSPVAFSSVVYQISVINFMTNIQMCFIVLCIALCESGLFIYLRSDYVFQLFFFGALISKHLSFFVLKQRYLSVFRYNVSGTKR